MKCTFSVLVENKPGVLARISGLFSARGFNICSLSVGETENPTISRMTIVVDGDQKILEQVGKQLNKLIDVLKVINLSERRHVERDLLLVKVNANNKNMSEILNLVNIFGAKIADMSPEGVIIEATGEEEKIKNFLKMLMPYGIKEVARTGITSLASWG